MSKQLRWQVFTRDSFTCRYCGRSPVTHPGTVLEVDHKHPVSLGGTDDIDNLLTACEPCNRGKLAQPLGEFDIPAVPPIAPVIRRSVSTVLSGTLGILSVFDSPIPSIKIYSRHAPRCPNKGGGRGSDSKLDCDCKKALRWSHGGRQHRKSLKTRSLKEAERALSKLENYFREEMAQAS